MFTSQGPIGAGAFFARVAHGFLALFRWKSETLGGFAIFGIFRSVSLLALSAGLTWGCGSERLTTSHVPEAGDRTGQPLGKLALNGMARAVVVASVQEGETPVSGVTVEFSRSVSGRTTDFEWSGTTNARGQARVEIRADHVSGYYQARAWYNGSLLGSWSSIPIKGGYELMVELPVGGKARVTGSSILTSGGLYGEIVIGVVLPLTIQLDPGGLATKSQASLTLKNGFELAREEINSSSQLGGASIEFIIEDSRGTAEGAVESFNKLIHQDGVPAILGPAISTAAKEAFPIAQQNQVVALSSTSSAAGLSAIGDFIFRVGLTVDVLVPGSVRKTHEKLGYRRVATIVDRIDVFSRSSDEALRSALAENGVKVLATETFETGDTTFTEQLTRIKALNPDAIFISAFPPDQPEILIQGRRLGIPYDVPFIVPLMTIDEIQAAGADAEGSVTFTGWTGTASTPGNQTFTENYRAKYGIEPNTWAALSYAALHILSQAIAEAGSADASAIRDAMAGIRDLDTVLGRFSFDANGDAVYDPIVLIVRDGKFEVFE